MKYCSDCGQLVERKTPPGDNRERWVCPNCSAIHYQNPRIVVGCVAADSEKRILLCTRAIEPRYGFWTVPAGFMELNETLQEGAARETREEALAEVNILHMFATVDVVQAGQVHIFFAADLISDFGAGDESLDARLFAADEIPWDNIAFPSGRFALERYLEDGGENNGVYTHSAFIKRLRV